MAANISQKDLTQVGQFWSMLDEMAEVNPEGYKKFIQRQLKDAREHCAPPEPHLSLQTKILDPEEKTLFINVCRWNMIPAPQSDTHPVPLSAGILDEISDGLELYTVIDVAYNPALLKLTNEDQTEKDQLIRLAMKYIEEIHGVTLCHSYQIASFKLKGSLKRMRERLRGLQTHTPAVKEERDNGKGASLLQQIKNISVKGEDKEELSHPIRLLKEDTVKHQKMCLIEEISSSEVQEKDTLPAPHYELSVVKDHAGASLKLELKVQLPKLSSVSDCDLSISKNDVLLEAAGKYRLQVDLPQSVDEDAVHAQFKKQDRTLFVTMPVL